MRKQSSLADKLDIAGMIAKYDDNAKNLLAEKIILAHILAHTIDFYLGMKPEQIVQFIEGEPKISKVGVLPGDTNSVNKTENDMPSIIGDNTESVIPNEGKITYDIRFTAWTPDRAHKLKLIIDLEAQKNFYTGYDMVTRGVFNVSRMVSAQYGTEFKKSNYQNIKRVYSIFICMNVPKYAENTITKYKLSEIQVVGKFPLGKVYYDIPNIVIVGLSNKIAEEKDEYRLHRMLETIFSEHISTGDKKHILEKEYGILMTDNSDRRVDGMCNLGEGIYERGIERGIEQGIERGIEQGKFDSIINLMNNMQLSIGEAMKMLNIPENDWKKYEKMMQA